MTIYVLKLNGGYIAINDGLNNFDFGGRDYAITSIVEQASYFYTRLEALAAWEKYHMPSGVAVERINI